MTNAKVLRGPALSDQRRSLAGANALPPAGTHKPSPEKESAAEAQTAGAAETAEAARAEGLRQGLADAQAHIEREIESRWQAQKTQWEKAEKRRVEEHAHRVASLDAILQALQKAAPERFMVLEQQAIALAYEALCRVCGPHAEQERGTDRAGLLVDLLRNGLKQLHGQPWLGVRLHPRDHSALIDHEAGRAFTLQHPHVRFSADATLEPLTVLLDTDHGQLDVSLTTQLSRLRELWAQAATGEPGREEL